MHSNGKACLWEPRVTQPFRTAARILGIAIIVLVTVGGFFSEFLGLLPFASNWRELLAIAESLIVAPPGLRLPFFALIYFNVLLICLYSTLDSRHRGVRHCSLYKYLCFVFCALIGLDHFCREQSVRSYQMALLLIGGPAYGICVKKLRLFSTNSSAFYWLFAAPLVGLAVLDWPFSFVYEYRGLRRSTGFWSNPNTYGLLCGALFNFTLCNLIEWPPSRVEGGYSKFGHMLCWTKFTQLACASFLLFGLITSYSRGAWVGSIAGIGFLIAKFISARCNHTSTSATSFHFRFSGMRAGIYALILFGVGITTLLGLMDSEVALLRRLSSVINVGDLAVRNRLYAWKGALVIGMEQPLIGCGLANIDAIYSVRYMPKDVNDPSAIHLNDYLTIAAGLGFPTAFLLIGIIWNRVRVGIEEFYRTTPAIIVLAVGAAFDGVLFRTPLAIVFWILIFADEGHNV